MKISYRFQQLFRDSVKNNKTDEFPTIVSIIRRAFALVPSNYVLNYSLSMIKHYKPKRVLLACHWIVYSVKNHRVNEDPIFDYDKMN